MEERKYKYDFKPLFKERMQKLLPNEDDFKAFERIVHTSPRNFIRCNTIKISPEKLIERLRKRWDVKQPFPEYPEIMLIESELKPGELGNAIEHVLGYYYVQEISSMMSALALEAQEGETILDLCASPGSKSSQIAAMMKNSGTLIANDIRIDRIKILSATLERCGVSNAIITRGDGIGLCNALGKKDFKFDRILLDAPCSGEGTLRSSPKTFLMWNPKVVKNLSRQQKKLFAFALRCLKKGGTIVYSTCTHAPEENESLVNFALTNFPVRIEEISLPLKCRPGITEWNEDVYHKDAVKACRIYPHDNDSEGFFVAKFTLLEEVKGESKFS